MIRIAEFGWIESLTFEEKPVLLARKRELERCPWHDIKPHIPEVTSDQENRTAYVEALQYLEDGF